MTKSTIAHLPEKLFALLSPLNSEERDRVVQATLILFGDDPQSATVPKGKQGTMVNANAGNSNDPGMYLDDKAPKNKGETLAVAARFREVNQHLETHSKVDLKKVITDARRNFDDSNFARDMNNAKRQSGFFNLSTGRDANTLSYYGRQFVDALPDREAASQLKRPKVGGNRKRAAKNKAPKKAKKQS